MPPTRDLEMCLNTADTKLFLTVTPAFIAGLPSAPSKLKFPYTASPVLDALFELRNNTTYLRFAVLELPKWFTDERARIELTPNDLSSASDALEKILTHFDRLVDSKILDGRKNPISGRLHKLRTLEQDIVNLDLLGGANTEQSFPGEIIELIRFSIQDDKRTKAEQYHHTTLVVENFYQTMQRVLYSQLAWENDLASRPIETGSNSFSSNNLEMDNNAILAARQKCDITTSFANLMAGRDINPCIPAHRAFISLDGFEEPKFETFLTICRNQPANTWHSLTISSPEYSQKTAREAICDRLKINRDRGMPSRIQIYPDGSWEHIPCVGVHRKLDCATEPTLTLEAAVNQRRVLGATSKTEVGFARPQKRELALKLTESFLCLLWSPLLRNPGRSDTIPLLHNPWQSRKNLLSRSPWNSKTIFMPDAPDSHGSSLKLYLKGYIGTSDLLQDQTATPERWKSFILDLGCLLLDVLFEAKVIITAEDKGYGNGGDIHDDDAAWWDGEDDRDFYDIYHNALNRVYLCQATKPIYWEDRHYLSVVNGCLDLYNMFDDDDLDPAMLQDEVYYNVVKPLRYYIQEPQHMLGSRNIRGYSSGVRREMPITRSIPSHRDTPSITVSPPVASGISAAFPAPSRDKASFLASDGTATESSRWLERYDSLKAHLLETGAMSRPVRIAILDTGCDTENDFFAGPGIDHIDNLMRHWADFAGEQGEPIDEDPKKHGTALTALLLRLVPDAAGVFVARVAKNEAELATSEGKIAMAIRHAVEKWDVDIISISFGFGQETQTVENALKAAANHKSDRILFFAAANNDGLNEPEMFPAHHENVISVRGTNHDGEFKQRYNPRAWPHNKGPQYGTLAVEVPCAWTSNELNRSGCSVATPIMAAIAAMIISYVASHEKSFEASAQYAIRTRRGMLLTFHGMAEGQISHKRRYLAPWFLFEHRSPVHLIGNALGHVPQKG